VSKMRKLLSVFLAVTSSRSSFCSLKETKNMVIWR